ncbi:hypothetical protein PSFL111601_13830 [Pseudomonas floridensis]
MAREQTGTTVSGLRNVQIQRFLRQNLTFIAVVQLLAGQGHRVLAGQFTAAVVDVGDSDSKGLGGADKTVLTVVQRVAAQGQCALGEHLAALLLKVADPRVEVLLACQLAKTVVCCCGAQIHIAVADQRAFGVGQGSIYRHVQPCAAADHAFGVVQTVTVDTQCRAGNIAFDIVQRFVHNQRQGLAAEQFAAAVVEAASVHSERLCAGDFAVLVGNAVKIFKQQYARGVDQTALIVQLAVVQVEAQRGVAEQFASLLIKAGDAGGQGQRAGNAPGVLVDDLACRQSQGVAAGQATTLTVVERTGGDLRSALAGQFAGLAVIHTCAGQRERRIGGDRTRLVAQGAGGDDVQGIGTGNAARGVLQRSSADGHGRFTAEQAAAVIERVRQNYVQVLLAGQRTACVIQTRTVQPQGVTEQQALGQVDHPRHFQPQRRARQHLASVTIVEGLGDDLHADLAGQFTGLVVDVGHIDFQRFCRAHQATGLVVERVTGQGQIALRNQLATLLSQSADSGDHVSLAGDTAATIENAVGLQLHQASGIEQAVLVIQTRADQLKTRITVDQPLLSSAQACLAVVECIDKQLHTVLGTNRTATVVHAGTAQHQQVLRCNTAATVIQRLAGQVHQTLGLQAATGAIVQCAGQLEVQLTIGDQRTGLPVVQTHRSNVGTLPCAQCSCLIIDGVDNHQFQKPVRHDLAFGIAQAERVERGGTSTGQLTILVRKRAGDVQQQISIAAHAATVIAQFACGQIDTVARHQATQVAQQPVDTHDQCIVAKHRARGVVQRRRGQREPMGAGDFAVLVIDRGEVLEQQLTGCCDQTTLVVQHTLAEVEADVSVTIQSAIVALIKACDHCGQGHGAGNSPSVTVVDQPGIDFQGAGAGQATALLVVERAGVEFHTLTGDTTVLAVVQAGTGERQG